MEGVTDELDEVVDESNKDEHDDGWSDKFFKVLGGNLHWMLFVWTEISVDLHVPFSGGENVFHMLLTGVSVNTDDDDLLFLLRRLLSVFNLELEHEQQDDDERWEEEQSEQLPSSDAAVDVYSLTWFPVDLHRLIDSSGDLFKGRI